MARSIWNGTITFGTVAVPVKVFGATESHTIHFNEVHEKDGARIEHRKVNPETGREVDSKNIGKAYDSGRGKQVVLTNEEIAAASGPRPKVIEIEHFVELGQIDPVFYDKSYHLGVGDGGEKAYKVLLKALEKSGKAGIGRFTMRTRESLIALRPLHGVLGLHTMRFDDELVDPKDLDLPALRKKPDDKAVKMAGRLVEMLAAEWKPASYKDTYREAVLEVIEQKAKGKEIEIPEREEPEADTDLLAALEASLGNGKPQAKAKSSVGSKSSGKSRTKKKSKAAA
jgi:DNA end-binding protein Ku